MLRSEEVISVAAWRHATKPQPSEYGRDVMSGLFTEHDVLPGGYEQLIGEDAMLAAIVRKVMNEAGLAGGDD